MRGIGGQWAMEVIADGRDLRLDPSRTMDFTIINNIHQSLPTFSVQFKDDSGVDLEEVLQDGTKLNVSVGLPGDAYENIQFAVMGLPEISAGGMYNTIKLSSVLDNMSWMRKVVDKNYKGNSSDVISQLAASVGLSADVDSTADMMNWLPNRTTIAQYARHVTNRAWASPTSAMILAVTDSGKVKFKNLDKLIETGPKKVLASIPSDGDLEIMNWSTTSKAALTNSAYGYGSTSIGMKEDGSFFEGNKVEMTLMSARSAISSLFQTAIGDLGGRINVLAPLAGNTHEKWNEAIHQNPRIKSSYGFDIEMIISKPSHLELLDIVKCIPVSASTGKPAQSMIGNYVVTATTKFITANRYWEKIVATSQSAGGIT